MKDRGISCVTPLLGALILTGCHEDRICTASFAMVQVVALTPAGLPVTGLTIRDTVVRTGQGFAVEQPTGVADGGYLVLSDNHSSKLGRSVEPVRVTGSDGNRGFAADFVFTADGCHIGKRSGPDTVVVRSL